MDGNVGIERARGDGKRMPLGCADRGNIQEQPLTGPVVHARFEELDLERIIRVTDHFVYARRAARLYLTVDPLDQIETASPKLPAPAFIAQTVVPEGRPGERRVRKLGVPDEASSGMGVEGEEERDKEVVGVPECFVRLLADSNVGGGEHHEHAE